MIGSKSHLAIYWAIAWQILDSAIMYQQQAKQIAKSMKDMDNIISSFTKNGEIIVVGKVLQVNLKAMHHCGNGLIKVATENYGELILNIIGGRRKQSPRAEVKDGDLIEACGVVTGDNAIDLVDPNRHYLRLK